MKVHNAGEVNKLFQLLDELEIEDAGISKTSHSQIEKFRKEIKIEAMKNAKDKSEAAIKNEKKDFMMLTLKFEKKIIKNSLDGSF